MQVLSDHTNEGCMSALWERSKDAIMDVYWMLTTKFDIDIIVCDIEAKGPKRVNDSTRYCTLSRGTYASNSNSNFVIHGLIISDSKNDFTRGFESRV